MPEEKKTYIVFSLPEEVYIEFLARYLGDSFGCFIKEFVLDEYSVNLEVYERIQIDLIDKDGEVIVKLIVPLKSPVML